MSAQTSTDLPSNSKPSLLPLILTVFIDLLGFAMFLPDLQLRGEGLVKELLGPDASKMWIGIMVGFGQSVYSIAQLATGTWLGRYSDINGRRPVLLISAAISVVAYILYAHAGSVFMLYLSRALSGVAAANLGVAYAYVADVTTPEERPGKLGLLGMSFGLGFLIGPPLGAFLLKIGKDSPLILGYFTAVLCAINFALTWFLVKESNFTRLESGKATFVQSLRTAFSVPGLSVLLMMFFMMNLSFTNLEATYFRLLEAPNWIFKVATENVKQFGAIVLVVVGLTGAITQGGLVKIVVRKLGELNTVRIFYLALIPVFIAIPFSQLWFPGIIITVLLGITNGLSGPSMSSLVSQRAPNEMQGSILGLTQSLGSLARVVGPVFANFLFGMQPYLPYVWGGILSLIPAALAWLVLKPMPRDPSANTQVMPH
jgi:MFS transporter, DHA1 family, tetracycline resistance protein